MKMPNEMSKHWSSAVGTLHDKTKEIPQKADNSESLESPTRLMRRQFVIDPIGGGYLLRRQSGSQPVKKSFPLDPIGGGYLLKRNAEDDISLQRQYDILRMTLASGKAKRSPQEPDFSIRFVPKEEIFSTLATDDSFLNNKNLHLVGMGLESFPIDPIGGGLLLGRSVIYDDPERKMSFLSGKQSQGYTKNGQLSSGNYLVH